MSKHTPGPWEYRVTADFLGIFPIASKTEICSLGLAPARDWPNGEAEETLANGRLIAAAPDLLEALEALLNADALTGVESLVAGWNGPPEKPYSPHPSNLGAQIKTTCGRIYKLDATMKAARAAIAKARGEA